MQDVSSDSQQHSDDGRAALARAMAEAAVRIVTVGTPAAPESESGGPEQKISRP